MFYIVDHEVLSTICYLLPFENLLQRLAGKISAHQYITVLDQSYEMGMKCLNLSFPDELMELEKPPTQVEK